MKFLRTSFRLLLVLWAGSLWSLAIWVAPTLFYAQSDRHLAGVLAAKLFTVETYLGIGVALLALLLPGRTRFFWLYFAAAVLAVNELILKRWMSLALTQGHAAGLSFGAWHGVAAALYLIACLAALVLIWKQDFR
jgi:hypothetical protein